MHSGGENGVKLGLKLSFFTASPALNGNRVHYIIISAGQRRTALQDLH